MNRYIAFFLRSFGIDHNFTTHYLMQKDFYE